MKLDCDHTEGNLVSLLAVSSGANFIERHFTIDKKSGPDNKISINPKETLELSIQLQQVFASLNVKGNYRLCKKYLLYAKKVSEVSRG